MAPKLPAVLSEISLTGLKRIDVSLEGDWSARVAPVWTLPAGFLGFSAVARQHPTHKPSLELYFRDYWVGCHCFRRVNGQNVFDEALALRIIDHVEDGLRGRARPC